MSTRQRSDKPVAAEPKQQRGRVRMAAILDAASRLFAEEPYDAVTMTAIAARSNTGIAQIYRFFPTKEQLADAILAQYRERIDSELDRLARQTKTFSPSELCDAFLAFMSGLGEHRSAALLLLDTRRNASEQRLDLRNLMLLRIRGVLADAIPETSAKGREGAAEVILQLLKLAVAEPASGRNAKASFRTEIRAALVAYLADLMGGASTARD